MASESAFEHLSRDELLAEVERLRRQVEDLQQERHDLQVILEMATEHADDISEQLEQERNDLAVILEVTTEHSDFVEEELHTRAEALETQSQFIREIFGRYVSEDVVAQLLDDPGGLELGGEKRQTTIMMSDLRGFTAIAESRDPQEVVRFLNRYLEGMLNIILSYQGTIIEILGDGLLVLFGAPIGRQDDAERAVACAVSMQLHMDEVNALLRQDNLPELEMGIGLHTGEVVVGNLGSVKYTRYGVIGGAVNLTGRIESYTTGNQILISPTTYAATADMLTVRQTLTIEPKGIAEPVSIYDVGGIGGTHQLFLPEQQDDLAPLTHELPVSYTVLEGNFPGQGMSTGRLVQLGVKSAELDIDEPVAALSSLKIRLYHPNGEPVPGALFAKVLTDASTEISTRVVMRFTHVPQHIQTFLDDAKHRWEFRTINRSVQL